MELTKYLVDPRIVIKELDIILSERYITLTSNFLTYFPVQAPTGNDPTRDLSHHRVELTHVQYLILRLVGVTKEEAILFTTLNSFLEYCTTHFNQDTKIDTLTIRSNELTFIIQSIPHPNVTLQDLQRIFEKYKLSAGYDTYTDRYEYQRVTRFLLTPTGLECRTTDEHTRLDYTNPNDFTKCKVQTVDGKLHYFFNFKDLIYFLHQAKLNQITDMLFEEDGQYTFIIK